MSHVTRLIFDSNKNISSSRTTLTNDIRRENSDDVGASNGQLNYYQPSRDYVQEIPDGPVSAPSTLSATAIDKPYQPRKEHWSWWTTIWSFISFVLCPACVYCTLGSLACNVFAYVDHRAGDYKRKHAKLRCALLFSIGSVALGFIVLIIVFVLLFAVFDAQNW